MVSWAGASADWHQSGFEPRQLPSRAAPPERIPSQARIILQLGCDIEAVDAVINHAQQQVQRLKPNRNRLACTPANRDQRHP